MIIIKKLSSSHHYYIAGKDLSYISLNTGELVFVCNQEKFQVLGLPLVKWDKVHFIDMDKTANELVMEILKQVGESEKEYKPIITEAWLAEVGSFESKKCKSDIQLWVDDIERLEIERWADFLETQDNPIFQDLAGFLKCHLEEDEEVENIVEKSHYRELLGFEIEAANKLADFLANHSNDVLREGADWIPQWIDAH
jgi:hypothetical protein